MDSINFLGSWGFFFCFLTGLYTEVKPVYCFDKAKNSQVPLLQ